MASQRLALSVGVIVLAAACFIIGCVAVAIPQWGHFRNRVVHETGNFGPWTICKDIDYGRQLCGSRIVMFQPMFVVFAAGVCGAVGVAAMGAYGLISILYLTVQSNPMSDIRRYKIYILIIKLIFSLVAALMTVTAVGLFATQGDDLEKGYIISVGFSFYMEVVLGLFSTILMLLTVGEYVTSRREPEVEVVDAGRTEIGLKGATIGNPGYRERATNGTISMTHSSGVPYVPSVRFKSNHNNHVGHNPQGGSGRRRTPPNKRHSNNASFNSKTPSSNRHKNGRPFSKDYDSWNGSVNSVTTSPAGSTVNGSSVSDFSSVSTISTVVSTTPTRGPLRSSLKKSRTSEDGFGIPNPGFSGSSPTLSRTSSLKKVRIQSYTTDV